MDEYAEVIILDGDEFDAESYRNATRDHRSNRSSGSRQVSRPRTGTAIIRRGGSRTTGGRWNAGSIVRKDTGGLSTGQLIEAGAQVLAAIQPLPNPPVATGKAEEDVANLVLYQTALAEHAKRDEQLRTIGSLASKFFA
jgi:hypothetical protein